MPSRIVRAILAATAITFHASAALGGIETHRIDYSFNESSGPTSLSIPRFDPQGGDRELVRVDVELAADFYLNWQVNAGGLPCNGCFATSFGESCVDLSPGPEICAMVEDTVYPPTGVTQYSSSRQLQDVATGSFSSAIQLAAFVGTGSVSVGVDSSLSFPDIDLLASVGFPVAEHQGLGQAALLVTYNFDLLTCTPPALPAGAGIQPLGSICEPTPCENTGESCELGLGARCPGIVVCEQPEGVEVCQLDMSIGELQICKCNVFASSTDPDRRDRGVWACHGTYPTSLSGNYLGMASASVSQPVDTPASPFLMSLQYQFTGDGGSLDVVLDGTVLASIAAPGMSEPVQTLEVLVDGALLNGTGLNLEIIANGSAVAVDNVSFPGLYNGDFETGDVDGFLATPELDGIVVVASPAALPTLHPGLATLLVTIVCGLALLTGSRRASARRGQ